MEFVYVILYFCYCRSFCLFVCFISLQCLIDNYGNIKTIINQKNKYGNTPLDMAYRNNNSPIKNEIVSLLRKYGGKANKYDKNGNKVGKGNGDLND